MKTIDTSRLPREACVELLHAVCIQTYDHESIDILREAVEVNVLDGTIDRALFNAVADAG
jgi:hypothetical protein